MPKRTDGAAPLPRGKPPPENEAAAKRTEIQAADEDSKQDDRITFTLFPDVGAQTKTEYRVSWDGLAAHVRSPGEFAVKAKCPLIKLARFGERRSEKNSLRHDANMIEITGIEGDYDGERLSVGEATMLLADADVEAVIYSSPSYTPDAPRWRVLAPFSKPYPPGERRRFMARLQGALAGILAPESFTLSQSYYIGKINGAPYEMQQIRGRPIDLIDELDGQAIDNGPVNGTSRTERLKELHSSDPVICRLEELGRILRERSDGGVDIHCPFEAQHTTQGGKGDCTYWPPNTGSFTCGHFKCLHSHCDKRRDDEFLAALELHQTALLNGESLGPPELSDDALADVFAQRHAQDWRYVAAWGQWLRWDGRRWTQDRTLAVVELVRHICREAAAILGNVRLARQVASAKTVMAVKHIARADPRIAATPEQWDARDFLLNTPGGTVDLHTGMLRLHQREDYLTKIAGVAPNASMPHPNFQRFLKDVTCGDEGLATYLRRIAGYCLTGDCREQVLILCVGVGANGKSTLLDALCYVFGDYAKVIAAETLLESRNGRHPTEIANLMGVRLALSSELEEGQAWSEARIKALTGDERLAGRFMRQDFFDFRKTHKHIVAGNHRPGLRTVDTAIRRRMHLIPFEAKFTGETRDRHMLDKLRAEGPAILAWAIQGCVDWQKHGLSMPQKVMAATDEYLASMDLLQLWIDECCVTTDPTSREKSSALYASFAAWKAERGEGVPSHMRFSEWLQGAGFRKLKSTGGAMVFEGIALSAEEKRRLAEGL